MNIKSLLLTLIAGLFIGFPVLASDNHSEGDSLHVGLHRMVAKEANPYSVVTSGEKIFDNSPEKDIKKALYGKIRGLHVKQGSGSSANNEASLMLYGKTPLILVDGFVRSSLSNLTAQEIESISVLTDAASTALYGVRGANGVVLVNTKKGTEGPIKVTANYQFGFNNAYRAPDFADSYLYANSLNQALVNDGLSPRYNEYELEAFRSNMYPMEYPNVNWWDEVYSSPGYTHNINLTFNGGNKRFRYFTAVDYYNDQSMLTRNTEDDRYNSRLTDLQLNLRTNIDVDVTETTYMRFNLLGQLKEHNSPNFNAGNFYSYMYTIPAAAFPIRHEDGTYGGSLTYQNNNPLAVLRDRGHSKNIYGALYADLFLEQKLDALTPGLKASVGLSFDNQGGMYENSVKTYAYKEHVATIDEITGAMSYEPHTYGTNSAILNLAQQGFSSLFLENNLQGKLSYERWFGKHKVEGAAIYDQYAYIANARNSSQKRQSFILNAGYNYDDRYMLTAVTSLSGSAYLPDGDKYKFYPAVSGAWIISNEEFMKGSDNIDYLRLHGSFGVSGWDGSLGHELWRYVYTTYGQYFFTDSDTPSYGIGQPMLPVEMLTVEKSKRGALGIDLSMFNNRLDMSVEGFMERRSDILVSSANFVTGIIGIDVSQENAGINDYRGASFALGWNDETGDFKYGLNGNITFMTSEIVNANQAFQEYPYLYVKGNRVNQMYGLEAIGFFQDQREINNSPTQTFSTVRPGDVKYKDQNGDAIIDSKDVVRMYGPSTPETWYGLNLHASYKGFDISADFQGITGVTVNLLQSPLYTPLLNNATISNTFLEREVAWTPGNSSNATMPRLTTQANANNYRNSSLWFRNGSFMKLRNLQLGYTLPKSAIGFADARVYLQGTNLFSIDNIEFADPEQLSAAYPSTRAFWAGVKFNF